MTNQRHESLFRRNLRGIRWFFRLAGLATAMGRGDPERILEAARRVLKLAPLDLVALEAAASAHLQLGNPEEAASVSQQILQQDPYHTSSLRRLAHLARERGDHPAAYSFLTRAITASERDREPSDSEAAWRADALDYLRSCEAQGLVTPDHFFQ
ncbi:MAG: tetratricopeptide repeat protein [Thermoanaerobaculia bacterium]